MEAASAAVVVESVAVVGAAEYLQWLGDMSNMLVHEQWRKEVRRCVRACVCFCLLPRHRADCKDGETIGRLLLYI